MAIRLLRELGVDPVWRCASRCSRAPSAEALVLPGRHGAGTLPAQHAPTSSAPVTPSPAARTAVASGVSPSQSDTPFRSAPASSSNSAVAT